MYRERIHGLKVLMDIPQHQRPGIVEGIAAIGVTLARVELARTPSFRSAT
jgi:hypothetical protein